jgi:hypothetical protein
MPTISAFLRHLTCRTTLISEMIAILHTLFTPGDLENSIPPLVSVALPVLNSLTPRCVCQHPTHISQRKCKKRTASTAITFRTTNFYCNFSRSRFRGGEGVGEGRAEGDKWLGQLSTTVAAEPNGRLLLKKVAGTFTHAA